MESKKLPSWLTLRRRGLGSRWPAAARTWVARASLGRVDGNTAARRERLQSPSLALRPNGDGNGAQRWAGSARQQRQSYNDAAERTW
ncbi:hypothetical protein NL676_010827 [Syzygium grande]|nr:hypothetical protein NL676_010827 [Syzygium grande]